LFLGEAKERWLMHAQTVLHKVEKALMLETDVPETINECVESVHKAGAIVSLYRCKKAAG
jgi:hypothetical protein